MDGRNQSLNDDQRLKSGGLPAFLSLMMISGDKPDIKRCLDALLNAEGAFLAEFAPNSEAMIRLASWFQDALDDSDLEPVEAILKILRRLPVPVMSEKFTANVDLLTDFSYPSNIRKLADQIIQQLRPTSKNLKENAHEGPVKKRTKIVPSRDTSSLAKAEGRKGGNIKVAWGDEARSNREVIVENRESVYGGWGLFAIKTIPNLDQLRDLLGEEEPHKNADEPLDESLGTASNTKSPKLSEIHLRRPLYGTDSGKQFARREAADEREKRYREKKQAQLKILQEKASSTEGWKVPRALEQPEAMEDEKTMKEKLAKVNWHKSPSVIEVQVASPYPKQDAHQEDINEQRTPSPDIAGGPASVKPSSPPPPPEPPRTVPSNNILTEITSLLPSPLQNLAKEAVVIAKESSSSSSSSPTPPQLAKVVDSSVNPPRYSSTSVNNYHHSAPNEVTTINHVQPVKGTSTSSYPPPIAAANNPQAAPAAYGTTSQQAWPPSYGNYNYQYANHQYGYQAAANNYHQAAAAAAPYPGSASYSQASSYDQARVQQHPNANYNGQFSGQAPHNYPQAVPSQPAGNYYANSLPAQTTSFNQNWASNGTLAPQNQPTPLINSGTQPPPYQYNHATQPGQTPPLPYNNQNSTTQRFPSPPPPAVYYAGPARPGYNNNAPTYQPYR